jgi:hypothetical protein
MPLEEARVHLDLARVAGGAEARDESWRQALVLLEPIGCRDFAPHVLAVSSPDRA